MTTRTIARGNLSTFARYAPTASKGPATSAMPPIQRPGNGYGHIAVPGVRLRSDAGGRARR